MISNTSPSPSTSKSSFTVEQPWIFSDVPLNENHQNKCQGSKMIQ